MHRKKKAAGNNSRRRESHSRGPAREGSWIGWRKDSRASVRPEAFPCTRQLTPHHEERLALRHSSFGPKDDAEAPRTRRSEGHRRSPAALGVSLPHDAKDGNGSQRHTVATNFLNRERVLQRRRKRPLQGERDGDRLSEESSLVGGTGAWRERTSR